jgi:hypothetical protein
MLRVILLISLLSSSAALADEPPFEVGSENRISVVVSHTFAREDALTRLGYLLSYWHERFQMVTEWVDGEAFITGSIFGLKVQARFTVTDGSIVAIASDPGWLWRGRAQSYVTKSVKRYMHPTYQDL